MLPACPGKLSLSISQDASLPASERRYKQPVVPVETVNGFGYGLTLFEGLSILFQMIQCRRYLPDEIGRKGRQ